MRHLVQLGLFGCLGFMVACQADRSGTNYDVTSEVAIDPDFKSACAKEIDAQMTAPSSPEITYQNMTAVPDQNAIIWIRRLQIWQSPDHGTSEFTDFSDKLVHA